MNNEKKSLTVPIKYYMAAIMMLSNNTDYFKKFIDDSNEPIKLDFDKIENEMIAAKVERDFLFKRIKFQRNLAIVILAVFVTITGIALY